MPLITLEAAVIINVVTFGSFIFLAVVLAYLGRSTDPRKKITLPWLNLSFGVLLIGFGLFVQVGRSLQYFTEDVTFISSFLLIMIGAILTFSSFTLLYSERVNELNILRKRQAEIQKIMKRLRQRYFKKQIPEEDLHKMYSELIRELTEIEVKLSEIKKK